ncbi:MAG: carbonic anhydrase [Flavitalea sp.]
MIKVLYFFSFFYLVSCSSHIKTKDVFPEDALQRLKEGNERFINDKALHPHLNHQRLFEVSETQKPFAVIVSCSDSRVPPELIFDQGLGDLFVIRTAGNVISEMELGSIEYAVHHLDVKTIIVMGHEDCGALKAVAENSEEEGSLNTLINHIKNEQEVIAIQKTHPSVNNLVQANIYHAIFQIDNLPIILKEKIKGKVTVVAAEYYLHDGKVAFLNY